MPRLVPALVAVLCLQACATLPTVRPPPARRNIELEVLRQGADQPNAAPLTLLALYGSFVASQRDAEAWEYFHRRAGEQPDQPLFLALEGVFMARVSGSIGLLNRVAWVNEGLGKLDRAVEKDPVFSRYLRALVLGEVPEEYFHQAARALVELTWAYEHREEFPYGLRRPIYRALALTHATLGHAAEAKQAQESSGYKTLDPAAAQFTTDTWFTQKAGVRFGAPSLKRCAPGVFCAQGFGFSDFFFIETTGGLVAIDAGFSVADMQAALEQLRKQTPAPITHVVFTHAHYDHIGGLKALLGPGVKVIAHANFADDVRLQRETGNPWKSFFAPGGPPALEIAPTKLVSERTALTVGGVELVLHPLKGGETDDTLLIQLPKAGLVFGGDAIMPYVGAPFFPEGSAEGLLESLKLMRSLSPKQVLHGHTAMTERWPAESLEGLELALRETHTRTVAGLQAGHPLSELLLDTPFPEALLKHPSAVIPYVATRTNFIMRLQRARTGYWQAGGEGLEPLGNRELGAALDLLGGGKESSLAEAAAKLLGQGDFALALRFADCGLTRYPGSAELTRVRMGALDRLRMQNEQTNPFKLIIFGEMEGVELQSLP